MKHQGLLGKDLQSYFDNEIWDNERTGVKKIGDQAQTKELGFGKFAKESGADLEGLEDLEDDLWSQEDTAREVKEDDFEGEFSQSLKKQEQGLETNEQNRKVTNYNIYLGCKFA